MSKETDKQRVFSRRALIFGGAMGAGFCALTGRLYYLQFMNGQKYATLSENNRIKLQLVAPARGNILDRNGVAMASSDTNYRLFLDYSTLTKETFKKTLENLQKTIKITESKLKALEKLKLSTAARSELIKENLTWEEVATLELHSMDLSGTTIDLGQVRYYPFTDEAAHLIGYMGAINDDDLSADDPPLMRLPDFKIGKNGVEKLLENDLRGEAGVRQLEVNVHGMPVREIGKTESIAGENTSLTIDSRLQHYAASLVKNESAGVVVMEVETGNVLALVSLPAFDPNIFSTGISTDYWKELSTDKKAPLLNKAISGQYPPGSTFKMIVGLAALEAKAITPETAVFCPGHFMLGDHKFNCWKEGGHGTVHYHEAIEQSCDTFFYTVAQKLGYEKIVAMAHRFGLGELHDIGLTGEKTGNIPTPAWKEKRFKQKWSGGDTINFSIGQGYVLATPLQLAVMAARMAGGKKVEPRLFVPEGEEKPVFASMGISDELQKINLSAMAAVANSPNGTAFGKRISDPRFLMGGKTGTSQVRKILVRGQNQNSIPWEARHHALFVGFAPIDNPKYACAVLVEHGGGGGATAAPIARDILLRIQQLDAGIEVNDTPKPIAPEPEASPKERDAPQEESTSGDSEPTLPAEDITEKPN
jgi:penicillin-binding protein 2